MSKADINRIQRLGLLDRNEKIIQFFSEHKNKTAGNFFTNKRLAEYWIGEIKSDNKVHFAYYEDIRSIDTVYHPGATYCPYMLVTKKDSTQFKVCVEGSRAEIKAFFEEALALWEQHKNSN